MSDIFKDFEKKNEVIKVKIPKFATGGICNDVIFPKFDMFPEIDEIVKDIRKQKDNALAMEFTKCIGELLRKNGVVLKMTEYTHENVRENSIEHRYGVSITGLDFFEHDKAFEDKIASLEKQIERLMREKQLAYDRSEQLMKTTDIINSANIELKQEKLDKNEKIAELACENESLKQRIDELEKELEEWKEEARVVKKQRDEQLKSFRKGIEPYVDLLHMHETIAGKNEKIAELEKGMGDYKQAFEDKCADYGVASELLCKYQQENESLKKRIIELENFSCQAEQETESLVEKLKQRISELEDKIGDRDEINRCLREQIAESESKESVTPMRIEFYADNGEPFTPLEVANSLINQNTLKVDELKELAGHLLVYCKHNKERNNEKEI